MTFLPVSINIDDKKILIVGGGKVALHKLKAIRQFTRNIRIVAPEIASEIKQSFPCVLEERYAERHLEGISLVYACTNDSQVNLDVKNAANKKGIMVNVADNGKECDFISPAIYREDHMTVSICSQGKEVKKSVAWRNEVERIFTKKKDSGNQK